MQRVLIIVLTLFLAHRLPAQELKVMTYNLRLDIASDGENAWQNRKNFLAAQVQFYAPDVFGVQEARPNQVTDLDTRLTGYEHVGVGRDPDNTGEASSIFYNKNRLQVQKSGTFWLSETPGVPSKGWDAAYNRVCTYALFYDKKAKKQFWAFNTHLDHVGEAARTKGLALILSTIDSLNRRHLPVILTGDFNTEPSASRLQQLLTQLVDTREVSVQKPFGPSGTFNNFEHNKPVIMRIDYIFISRKPSFRVNKYAVLSDAKDLRYPSDHLPVYVDLSYP